MDAKPEELVLGQVRPLVYSSGRELEFGSGSEIPGLNMRWCKASTSHP